MAKPFVNINGITITNGNKPLPVIHLLLKNLLDGLVYFKKLLLIVRTYGIV